MGLVKGRKLRTNEGYRGGAKEGTCLLVKEELKRNVKEWREVTSRLTRMRMMLGCERWVSVAAYGPHEDSSKWKRGIISGKA